MLPKCDELIYIQSYKHDGSLHRTWAKGYVLEANEQRFVVVTNKTWVIESDKVETGLLVNRLFVFFIQINGIM